MSRRSKIIFAVGCGVAGLLAWFFLSGEDQEPVRLTVFPISSNRVSLTITNSFKTSIYFHIHGVEFRPNTTVGFSGDGDVVMGHSERSIETEMYLTNQWQFLVTYTGSLSSSLVTRLREGASEYAQEHTWLRFAAWVQPPRRTKTIYGPLMLGNQPVEPAPK